ncbi:MAG TPA: tyrosine-protein phosphatase [Thermoanaerobaculia bacterium]|nr:tyrosine-protein phosphatase [Thermoanaerobaculia bacterium]
MPTIKRRIFPLLAVVLASFVPAFASPLSARPESWAVAVPAKGVENFYRVEPDLYRSARPGSDGFRELQALGVKTVLDVESPGDEMLARGMSLKLVHVPMTAFGLRDDLVLRALRIMADPANRPVVVHCHLGADRTGALVALYRVVVQGWSKADAIREMDDGGYHHSSWWRNLDRYVAAANVDALRKELGIARPGATLLAALGKSGPEGAAIVVTAATAPAPGVSSSRADSVPAASSQAAEAPESSGIAAPATLKPGEKSASNPARDRR